MFGLTVTLTAIILGSFCLLSTIPGKYWLLRAFDFPKIQLLLLLLGLIFTIAIGNITLLQITAIIIASVAAVHCLYYVWPYFPIAATESKPATGVGKQLKLLIANVEMENQNFAGLLAILKAQDPDIFLLIETDDAWQQHISVLQEHYPHRVEKPNSSHSGLLLYSKYPFENAEVRYLVKDYIPSIRAEITMPRHQNIVFHGVHPRPPRPENSAKGRDEELWIVAKEIAAAPNVPTIVTGDMNDVGWSCTTTRFQRISGLLDPRKGRGFYNSYHARFPLWRWPLDHVFHSDHFRVVQLQRLEKFGSDHYPISIVLELPT